MSMWMFFQGLKPSDVPKDEAACDALFDVEFDELRQRVRAGTAVWLERSVYLLNDVYWAQEAMGRDRDLPVLSLTLSGILGFGCT